MPVQNTRSFSAHSRVNTIVTKMYLETSEKYFAQTDQRPSAVTNDKCSVAIAILVMSIECLRNQAFFMFKKNSWDESIFKNKEELNFNSDVTVNQLMKVLSFDPPSSYMMQLDAANKHMFGSAFSGASQTRKPLNSLNYQNKTWVPDHLRDRVQEIFFVRHAITHSFPYEISYHYDEDWKFERLEQTGLLESFGKKSFTDRTIEKDGLTRMKYTLMKVQPGLIGWEELNTALILYLVLVALLKHAYPDQYWSGVEFYTKTSPETVTLAKNISDNYQLLNEDFEHNKEYKTNVQNLLKHLSVYKPFIGSSIDTPFNYWCPSCKSMHNPKEHENH